MKWKNKGGHRRASCSGVLFRIKQEDGGHVLSYRDPKGAWTNHDIYTSRVEAETMAEAIATVFIDLQHVQQEALNRRRERAREWEEMDPQDKVICRLFDMYKAANPSLRKEMRKRLPPGAAEEFDSILSEIDEKIAGGESDANQNPPRSLDRPTG